MPSNSSLNSASLSNNRNNPAFQRIRLLTHVLDNAIPIPGTTYRVGLDPLLGLVPGGGDTVGLLLSAYIVLEAVQFRLPRETLIRMVSNLLLDSVIGAVPFLGDVFDFTWKANSRNVALLEAHLNNPHPQRAADRQFLIAVVTVVLLISMAAIALLVIIFAALWQAIAG